MPTYGQRPDDVVQDSRGNALKGITVSVYATEAAARAGGTPDGTSVTDEYGRWSHTAAAGSELWARLPNGMVWQVAEQVVTDLSNYYTKTQVDSLSALTTASGTAIDLPADPVGTMYGYVCTATTTIAGFPCGVGTWILVMESDGWHAYQAGAGAAALPAPTVSVTGQTVDSITVAYSTTTTGVTNWVYSLDGGADAALDGTSPDTITGLTPGHTGTIKARYSRDGGSTWSDYSTPVSYTTDTPPAQQLTMSWDASYAATASGSGATAWTYTPTGASMRLRSIDFLADADTGNYDFAFTGTPANGDCVFLASPNAGPLTTTPLAQTGFKVQTGTYWIGNVDNTTGTDTAITPAPGDVIRVQKDSTTSLSYHRSTDGGATFTQVGTSTITAGSFWQAYLRSASALSVSAGGTKRWGGTPALLRGTITGTGIIESGDATNGWTYAMAAAGTGYVLGQTGVTVGTVEAGVGNLVAATEGGALGVDRDTNGGGTVNNGNTTGYYMRVAADHSIYYKVPNVGEVQAAGTSVTNSSRLAIILLSDASWQRCTMAYSPDGTHQWVQINAPSVAGPAGTPNTYNPGASCATGQMDLVVPKVYA